jgi:hypothetical protein
MKSAVKGSADNRLVCCDPFQCRQMFCPKFGIAVMKAEQGSASRLGASIHLGSAGRRIPRNKPNDAPSIQIAQSLGRADRYDDPFGQTRIDSQIVDQINDQILISPDWND